MGVFDAPTWVLAAWRRSLQDVGATADRPTLETYGERMIERWSAPERIHHNLRRLIAVLARVDELAPETHDPDVVRLAAWYHGAVFNAAAQQAYAHRGGVDEAASAELARTELTELGVPANLVQRIATLILDIARHSAPKDDIDAQALCDADLGGLAAEPQRYAAYRKEVRAEYAHIPQQDYVRARLAIVTKLLGRTRLFRSPMAQDWEDAARENLTAELDRLTAEAGRLAAAGDLPAAEVPPAAKGRAEPSEPGSGEQAGDGGAHRGSDTGPGVGGAQAAGDGGAQVSPAGTRAVSAGTRAAPEEGERRDDRSGPRSVEPRGDDPHATDREATVAGGSRGAERVADGAQSEGSERADGASIENAPEDARAAEHTTSGGAPVEHGGAAPQAETVAQRSQRRWAEHRAREAADQEVADQQAADRGGKSSGLVRRRGTSASSPLEPRNDKTGRDDEAEAATDDLDKTSSLSRPPRMPAVKRRRPPEVD